MRSARRLLPVATVVAACALLAPAAPVFAQTPQPQQKVTPPEAQAWIDLATYSGFGMGGMGGIASGGGGGGGGAIGMLSGMLGNATGLNTNRFGHTRTGIGGRWMDVTLSVRKQPGLQDATMTVPQGSGLAPTLKLVSPKNAPPAPPVRAEDERDSEPQEMEKPKGKISLYWGCGDDVRPGQPRTVDFATALPQDLMQIFNGRRATQRGTHSAVGRPVWPSEADSRMVPGNAVLAGEMGFAGTGVPESFRFQLPPAQDLMPTLDLQQQADPSGATKLSWAALPAARGYFIAAMGARKDEDGHMILWTSSELPDSGFGLVDYQTNSAVDRWEKEKVLLPPATTGCTIPKGVFSGEGAMLRAIAYGSELNLVHPPRPADPKVTWEQEWAVKIRLKSVTTAVLGMDMGGGRKPAAENKPEENKKPSKLDILRGLLGK